ncbi:MAG: hypothetical protein R3E32_00295 [Chitinophagales bacterium]
MAVAPYLPRFWAWENGLFVVGYLLTVLIGGGWLMGLLLLKIRDFNNK